MQRAGRVRVQMILIVSIVVVLALGAGLVVAERRGHLLLACAAILAILAVGWVLAALAVRSDYRDADGFTDCSFYCSPFQEGVGATLFYGPVTAVLVLVTAGALVWLRRRRPRAA